MTEPQEENKPAAEPTAASQPEAQPTVPKQPEAQPTEAKKPMNRFEEFEKFVNKNLVWIFLIALIINGAFIRYFSDSQQHKNLWNAIAILVIFLISGGLIAAVSAIQRFSAINKRNREIVSLSILAYLALGFALLLTRSRFTNEWAILLAGLLPIIIFIVLFALRYFSKISLKFGSLQIDLERSGGKKQITIPLDSLTKYQNQAGKISLSEFKLPQPSKDIETLVIEIRQTENALPGSLSNFIQELRRLFPNLKQIVFVTLQREYIAHISVNKFLHHYPSKSISLFFGLNLQEFERLKISFQNVNQLPDNDPLNGLRNIINTLSEYEKNFPVQEEVIRRYLLWVMPIQLVDVIELGQSAKTNKTKPLELLNEMKRQGVDSIAVVDEKNQFLFLPVFATYTDQVVRRLNLE